MLDCPPCHYEYVIPSWEYELDEMMMEFCEYYKISRKDFLDFLKKIVSELEHVDGVD